MMYRSRWSAARSSGCSARTAPQDDAHPDDPRHHQARQRPARDLRQAVRAGDRDRIGYLPKSAASTRASRSAPCSSTSARSRADPRRCAHRVGEMARTARARRCRGTESRAALERQPAEGAARRDARAAPPIVILDEPLSGLDPVSARLVTGIMRDCAAAGQTVLLSTHQMGMVESLCTRVFMMARTRRARRRAARHQRRSRATPSASSRPPTTDRARWSSESTPRPTDRSMSTCARRRRRRLPALARAAGTRVEHFERMSTPLEEIFVRVATRTPGGRMTKTWLIARWEFLATVTRRAYIFAVVAMPLLFGIIGAIPVISARSAAMSSADLPVALVDPAALVDLELAARLAVERSQARTPGTPPDGGSLRPEGIPQVHRAASRAGRPEREKVVVGVRAGAGLRDQRCRSRRTGAAVASSPRRSRTSGRPRSSTRSARACCKPSSPATHSRGRTRRPRV